MERERFHFHVDIMTPDSRLIESSQALTKSAAEKLFRRVVEEYRLQTGKFQIRPASERDHEAGFIGAVRIATNHRLVIVLSRCDCETQSGGEAYAGI